MELKCRKNGKKMPIKWRQNAIKIGPKWRTKWGQNDDKMG